MTTYVYPNCKSKAELKQLVAEGKPVRFVPQGMGPQIGPDFTGTILDLMGPHYPKPHKWYANVKMENGKIIKIT